jgi:hypothetical protein
LYGLATQPSTAAAFRCKLFRSALLLLLVPWGFIVKKFIALAAVVFTLAFVSSREAAWAQSPSPVKPLTIEAIYAPGGLGGRGPETMEWSPDDTKLSFLQRDDEGEHGELWYVDATSGEKKVLVSATKLASLAPDYNKVKDER